MSDTVESLLRRAEEAEKLRRGIAATLIVETSEKLSETWRRASGFLVLRAGEDGVRTLVVELKDDRPGTRPVRTLVRREEVISCTLEGRGGRAGEVAAVKGFHPFELWRRGLGPWVLELFDVSLVSTPDVEELPAAVSGPDGTPVPVHRARSRGSWKGAFHASAEPGGPGPRRYVLDLVPRQAWLRKTLVSIRVYVDSDPLHVSHLEVDAHTRRVDYSMVDVREVLPGDASVFEPPDAGDQRR